MAVNTSSQSNDAFEWGPFLTEREWGTAREDFTPTCDSWNATTYESANASNYFCAEDGLLGVCHKSGLLCFAASFWNGRDKLVKQRLFGLSGPEGNHGEDVKEYYAYGLCCPNYRYYDAFYRLSQLEFPIRQLREVSKKRTRHDAEFEVEDTGVFASGQYWDVHIEYATRDDNTPPTMSITVRNCASNEAELTIAPRVWFASNGKTAATVQLLSPTQVLVQHAVTGRYKVTFGDLLSETQSSKVAPWVLCVRDNEKGRWKQVVDDCMKHPARSSKFNEAGATACAGIYRCNLPPDAEARLQITWQHDFNEPQINTVRVHDLLATRRREATAFYRSIGVASSTAQRICQAAYSLILWNHQVYTYNPQKNADETRRRAGRRRALAFLCAGRSDVSSRNDEWPEFNVCNVLAIPDRWEFPWFALWDWCLQMRVLVDIQPRFAATQLQLVLSSAMMRCDGALPGCEYVLSDQNPPLVAWTTLHVFRTLTDSRVAMATLRECYCRLQRNFDWWLSCSCATGALRHLYASGFLGLDNVSIIDRTGAGNTLPKNCVLAQVDATSWTCFYALCMREIAATLEQSETIAEQKAEFASQKLGYEVLFEQIRDALRSRLFDKEDGFFYDTVFITDDLQEPVAWIRLRVRSVVGVIPLLCTSFDRQSQRLLSIMTPEETKLLLHCYLFNQTELLGNFGLRSLSVQHANANSVNLRIESESESPDALQRAKQCLQLLSKQAADFHYVAAESDSAMFGGNSNWRGPVWLCINYLLLESLYRLEKVGVNFSNEHGTTGSKLLSERLVSLFDRDCSWRRFSFADSEQLLFHEFYDPDNGKGCGASFQGWTALIACIIRMLHDPSYVAAHLDLDWSIPQQ